MKCLIQSWARPSAICSPAIFQAAGYEVIITVHNEQQKEAYLASGKVNGCRLTVANGSPKLSMPEVRQWAEDAFIKEGEWFVNGDDNIEKITAVDLELYGTEELPVQEDKELAKKFHSEVPPKRLKAIFGEVVEKAKETGANYCGFATVDNFYFRGKKWRDVGYVLGRMFLKKKTQLRYPSGVETMDDYAMTAAQLETYGRVLINQFVLPHKKHYQPGGAGTYIERLEAKKRDCKAIMERYPGLYRFNEKEGCDPEAEIILRLHSTEQVAAWKAKKDADKLQGSLF